MQQEHKRYKLSQWVMLLHDNKCLLVKYNREPGWWELPGGRVDTGEVDVEAAMKREVLEETGITRMEIIDQVGWQANDWPNDNATVNSISLATTNETDVTLSHEHSIYAWVSEEDIDKYEFKWKKATALIKKGFILYRLHNA